LAGSNVLQEYLPACLAGSHVLQEYLPANTIVTQKSLIVSQRCLAGSNVLQEYLPANTIVTQKSPCAASDVMITAAHATTDAAERGTSRDRRVGDIAECGVV